MTTSDQQPDDHTTDEAEMESRSEGAHQPIVDDEANLDPGEAGDDDEAPEIVGGEDDSSKAQRKELVDEVREGD